MSDTSNHHELRFPLCCAFCGRTQWAVPKLVAGPGVHICSDCVATIEEKIAGAGGQSGWTQACRFCGKDGALVAGMLVGPGAFGSVSICNECVAIARGALEEDPVCESERSHEFACTFCDQKQPANEVIVGFRANICAGCLADAVSLLGATAATRRVAATTDRRARCSFCLRFAAELRHLLAGTEPHAKAAFICDECVELASEALRGRGEH
ncbi:MAG: ClpX C4-type zinc finger protein [Myxococcales bacterium]